MKKLLAILLILSVTALCACSGGAAQTAGQVQTSFGEDWLLNTYCYIQLYEPGQEDLIKDTFRYARELESKLSRTIETSAVSQINDGSAADTFDGNDEEFADVAEILKLSLSVSALSEGRFDVTIGSVTPLWDFSSEDPQVPDRAAVEAELPYIGTDMISVDENGIISKAYDEVKIDLGAVGKGYIAQKIADRLVSEGVQRGIISIGGNLVLIGVKEDGQPWNINIESPFNEDKTKRLEEREIFGSLDIDPSVYDSERDIKNVSLVTSGTYERCFEKDGVTYHHVLDPETGFPTDTDVISATIIGADSCVCDALSTSCLILGSSGAPAFIEKYNEENGSNYGYVFILENGEILTGGADFSPAD